MLCSRSDASAKKGSIGVTVLSEPEPRIIPALEPAHALQLLQSQPCACLQRADRAQPDVDAQRLLAAGLDLEVALDAARQAAPGAVCDWRSQRDGSPTGVRTRPSQG